MTYIKQCTHCKITKVTTEFYKCNSLKTELQFWCKSCHKEYAKKYAKDHKAHIKKARKKNSVRDTEYRKEYYKLHREYFRAYSKKYRQTEKGKLALKKGLTKYRTKGK